MALADMDVRTIGDVDPSYLDEVVTEVKGDPRFHALLKRIGELHDAKQQDYGQDEDPLANIRGSAEWGVKPWIGAMLRAGDKVKRLQKYAKVGNLRNESVQDSFMDNAVYSLLAMILHDEEQDGSK